MKYNFKSPKDEQIHYLHELIIQFINSQPLHLFDLVKVHIFLHQIEKASRRLGQMSLQQRLIDDTRDKISLYPQQASNVFLALELAWDHLKYPSANLLYQSALKLISRIDSKHKCCAVSDAVLLLSIVEVSIHTPNDAQCDELLRYSFEMLISGVMLLMKRPIISINSVLNADFISLLLKNKYLNPLASSAQHSKITDLHQLHAVNSHRSFSVFFQQKNYLVNQAITEINDCYCLLFAQNSLFFQKLPIDILHSIMTLLAPRLNNQTIKELLTHVTKSNISSSKNQSTHPDINPSPS